MAQKKIATYYNCGRLSGDVADLFMFTCWNESRTSCGFHSVYETGLQANIEALERLGYEVLHAADYSAAATPHPDTAVSP